MYSKLNKIALEVYRNMIKCIPKMKNFNLKLRFGKFEFSDFNQGHFLDLLEVFSDFEMFESR